MRAKTCENNRSARNARPYTHVSGNTGPNQRVSDFMGYLKGKSTMIIFERYSNLKYKYGNRHFWCRSPANKSQVLKRKKYIFLTAKKGYNKQSWILVIFLKSSLINCL